MGAKLMTLECGMRFLTDHLQNDIYFKIHRENHNLDRARTQFKLVADMEAKWDQMNAIVEKYLWCFIKMEKPHPSPLTCVVNIVFMRTKWKSAARLLNGIMSFATWKT